MPYQFLEEVATADIAFRAWGENLPDVFVAASDASLNVMIENLAGIEFKEKRSLDLDNASLVMLPCIPKQGTARQIVQEAGADYLLTVKANQKELRQTLAQRLARFKQ